MIPKIIWQTHNYKYNDLPEHIKQISRTWINLNDGWEYKYMDHNERLDIIKEYPMLLKGYMYQRPTIQSDIWRFIITYKYGGVYADMDSICTKPLDYMLSGIKNPSEMVVTEPLNTANYAIIKKSGIMKKIINDIISYEIIDDKKKNWNTWGCFYDVVSVNQNVTQGFTAATHSAIYKSMFSPRYDIDYYGHSILYEDFCLDKGYII